MAKLSAINNNKKKMSLAKSFEKRRSSLKSLVKNKQLPLEERINATLKLAELPRNSSKTRVRNRCLITGRPRGGYRKFQMSRIALREFGSQGLIPGLIKASW